LRQTNAPVCAAGRAPLGRSHPLDATGLRATAQPDRAAVVDILTAERGRALNMHWPLRGRGAALCRKRDAAVLNGTSFVRAIRVPPINRFVVVVFVTAIVVGHPRLRADDRRGSRAARGTPRCGCLVVVAVGRTGHKRLVGRCR